MALANRDTVAMSAAPPLSLPVQGPIFGIVDDAASVKVLWGNGTFSTGITAISLDKITPAADAVADEFVGRRVQINSPTGQTNWGLCTCIAAYKRDPGGAGTQIIQVLLLQNPGGEYYIEALATSCSVAN